VAAREASTGGGKPAHRGADEGLKPTKASLKSSIKAPTGDGKPAHRGADEGLKPTKASLKASIEARPRGYVPHHPSMRHQGGAR
jgi:hypothetical protein